MLMVTGRHIFRKVFQLAELPSYAEIVDSEQGMLLEGPDEVREQ
jgi:hypothetical protein